MGIQISIDMDKISRSRVYLTRLEDASVQSVDTAREYLERNLDKVNGALVNANRRLMNGQRASYTVTSASILGAEGVDLDAASAVYNEALDAHQTVMHFINAIREEIGS